MKSVPEILKKREGEASDQVCLGGDVADISGERALPSRAVPEAVFGGDAAGPVTVVAQNGLRFRRRVRWLGGVGVEVLRHAAAIGEGGHRRRVGPDWIC